jgi:hypothetical protein
VPDETFIDGLHEVGAGLASRSDIGEASFRDVARGAVAIDG